MREQSPQFQLLLDRVRQIAKEVAGKHADDVDQNARFPIETINALKAAGLLSAPILPAFGGAGCGLRELAVLSATLAGACGSSGMVLAMHYSQVACLVRHTQGNEYFDAYQREISDKQLLLASITSEVGTFGDTRSSICAVERSNGRFKLSKEATTGSYCAFADDILVTCRTSATAPAQDQCLILVRKAEASLAQTTTWDTMGMRGTCSPGFSLHATGQEAQIFPCLFADISAQTMVPYSHILWSALWWGIAADAISKAGAYVRSVARKNPGTIPPAASRLAEASMQLQSMQHNWLALADEFDVTVQKPNGHEIFQQIGWILKMNHLKMAVSDLAHQVVHQALQIVGLLGYKNDSPYSMNRHYRDVLSATLMISNDRVASKSAALLLVFKDE